MVTEKQKQIYNTYQKSVFGAVEHKFRYRKDFDTFDTDEPEKYECLVRLEKMFTDFPGINEELFFSAPYLVHPEEYKGRILDLLFYPTSKAVKIYKIYMTTEHSFDISDVKVQTEIVHNIQYVIDFCRETGITLKQYLASGGDGVPPMWCTHFATNRINKWILVAFILCGFDLFAKLRTILTVDEVRFYLGEQGQTLYDDVEYVKETRYEEFLKKLCVRAYELTAKKES